MISVFLKAVACVLTGLVLWLCLSKHNKDMSILLTLAVCALVLIAAVTVLKPVFVFIQKLQGLGALDENLFSVLFRVVGIALISEISTLICKDAGNEAMGKTLQLIASATVLWISIPVFEKLLSLLDKILDKV